VQLAVGEWDAILTALEVKVDPTADQGVFPRALVNLSGETKRRLAEMLQVEFPTALRKVLKQDFAASGEAFAGLMLDAIAAILQTVREGSSQERVLQEQLEASARELRADGERAVRQLWSEMETGFAELCSRFGNVETSLQALRDELAGQLDSLGEGQQRILIGQQQILEKIGAGSAEGRGAALVEVNAVPPPVTDWQGREAELGELRAALSDEDKRLILVTAPGGYGKSALAAKFFEECDRAGEWRTLWVTFGQAYGFGQFGGWVLGQLEEFYDERWDDATLVRRLVRGLSRHRCLLVLDNLETVVAAEARETYERFLQQWARSGQTSALLLTSREQPQLSRNLIRRVCVLPLTGLARADAVALARQKDVRGTDGELAAFVEQMGRHPLLIDLVAALLWDEFGDAPPASRVSELGLNLFAVEGFHKDAETSVGEVFAASLARLTPMQRQLLTRSSVLRVGFTVELAAALQAGATEADLRGLARRSLLQEQRPQGGQPRRFQFLPLIRDYARQRAEEPELRTANELALSYFQQALKPPPWEELADLQEYLEAFHHACELQQWRVAYDILDDTRSDARDRPKKDKSCDDFLNLQGYNRVRAELYLRLTDARPESQQTEFDFRESLNRLGLCYYSQGEVPRAIDFHQQHNELARAIGNRQGEAASLGNLGLCYRSQGEVQRAIDLHQQHNELARAIGDRQGEAIALANLGESAIALEEYAEAEDKLRTSLEMFREMGAKAEESEVLRLLSQLAYETKQYLQARDLCQEALQLAQTLGIPMARECEELLAEIDRALANESP